MKNIPTNSLPQSLRSEGEQNAFLLRFKKTRETKIVLSRSQCLSDLSDLVIFYVALSRWSDAIEAASFLIDQVSYPAPYDALLWWPVASAVLFKYFALRQLSHEKAAKETVLFLEVHPGHSRYSASSANSRLDETGEWLTEVEDSDLSAGEARQALVAVVRQAGELFLEADANLDNCDEYPAERAKRQFDRALGLLKDSLEVGRRAQKKALN